MSALICLAKDFNQLDAVVDPVLHIKANGELLVFMIVVSAVITYCFGPTDFFKNNPIRRMAGYNNPCAAWDSPPALYFASLTYSGVIYCAIRYAILDGQRVNNDLRIGQSIHQNSELDVCVEPSLHVLDFCGDTARWHFVLYASSSRGLSAVCSFPFSVCNC